MAEKKKVSISVAAPSLSPKAKIALGVAIGLLGAVIAFNVGDSSGYKRGNAEGFEAGNVDGWNRGTEAAIEKAWWDGVVVGCELVFETTGWEFIFGNTALGKPYTVGKDSYCRDNGDHSNTPSFDFPYVAPGN
jgi:hypothetical protein